MEQDTPPRKRKVLTQGASGSPVRPHVTLDLPTTSPPSSTSLASPKATELEHARTSPDGKTYTDPAESPLKKQRLVAKMGKRVSPKKDAALSSRASSSSPSPSRRSSIQISPSRSHKLPASTFSSGSPIASSSNLELQPQTGANTEATSGPKTYARSRSFIVDMSEHDALLMPLQETRNATCLGASMMKAQASYTAMRQKWNIDAQKPRDHSADSGDEEGEEMSQLGLLGLTALRTHGESKRFDDQLQYFLDGMAPSGPLGLRRSSTVEVLRMMTQDVDFYRRLRTTGQLAELLDHIYKSVMANPNDRILATCMAYFLVQVTTHSKDADHIARHLVSPSSQATDMFASLLQSKFANEPLEKRGGATKAEIKMLQSIADMVASNTSMSDVDAATVTIQRLVLSALTNLVTRPTDAHKTRLVTALSELLPLLLQLLSTNLAQTDGLLQRISSAETTMQAAPFGLDLLQLERIFQLVEVFSSSSTTTTTSWDEAFARRLVTFVAVSHCMTGGDHNLQLAATALDSLIASVKATINLCNWDLTLSHALLHLPLMWHTMLRLVQSTQEDFDTGTGLKFDLLCFVLGLMTNLLDSSIDVSRDATLQQILTSSSYAPTCQIEPQCIQQCSCQPQEPIFLCLVKLYMSHLPSSSEPDALEKKKILDKNANLEADRAFVSTYTCILLGLLMVDNAQLCALAASELQKHDCGIDALVQDLVKQADTLSQLFQGQGKQGSDKLKGIVHYLHLQRNV